MTASFDAHTINLAHFAPQAYTYPPTGLEVLAFQVTDENIGALSVDFQADLMYDAGLPYFVLRATRNPENDGQLAGEPFRSVETFLNDWVVFLRGELHVFRDVHFRATFASNRNLNEGWAGEPPTGPRMNWMDQEQVDMSRSLQVRKEDIEQTTIGQPVPTPHPRRKVNPNGPQGGEVWAEPGRELPDLVSPVQFTAKTRVNWKDDEDGDGAILEGPNEKDEYFVKFDHGGAKWCNVADLRYLPQPVEEG